MKRKYRSRTGDLLRFLSAVVVLLIIQGPVMAHDNPEQTRRVDFSYNAGKGFKAGATTQLSVNITSSADQTYSYKFVMYTYDPRIKINGRTKRKFVKRGTIYASGKQTFRISLTPYRRMKDGVIDMVGQLELIDPKTEKMVSRGVIQHHLVIEFSARVGVLTDYISLLRKSDGSAKTSVYGRRSSYFYRPVKPYEDLTARAKGGAEAKGFKPTAFDPYKQNPALLGKIIDGVDERGMKLDINLYKGEDGSEGLDNQNTPPGIKRPTGNITPPTGNNVTPTPTVR